MKPEVRKRQRRLQFVTGLLALVVIGGVCTLRLHDLRDERDDSRDAALISLSDAVEGGPDKQTAAGYATARDRATDAARAGAVLVDPMAAFLLTLVDAVEAAAKLDAPASENVDDQLAWLIAHDQLARAMTVADEAVSKDRDGQRYLLYREVIEAMRAHRE